VPFAMAQIKKCPGGKDAECAAGDLFGRVKQRAMPVRRQCLKIFEPDRGNKDDDAYKGDAPGIGQREQRTEYRKCDDMLETADRPHSRPQQLGGQPMIDRLGELELCQRGVGKCAETGPGGAEDELLKHRVS
jgi:type II secretory pathway component PulJ